MYKLVPLTLRFPLAGVARRINYRQYEAPYVTPYAYNVRGIATQDGRELAGSRPGLVRVAATSEGTGTWQWPNGQLIEWPDGQPITFELTTPVITGPSGAKIIDPAALLRVTSAKGNAPEGFTVSCIYRDRVVVAKDHIWYASRVGDHTDWDYGADMGDHGGAIAGNLGLAGQKGESITALIPVRDRALLIATKTTLHLISGDPRSGEASVVSDTLGVIAPYAWAMRDNTVMFLSHDGVYHYTLGQGIEQFGAKQGQPFELRNINATTNTILMAWDQYGDGFHLFITPVESTATGSHYWLDAVYQAVWPVSFVAPGHQPVAACTIIHDNHLKEIALRCNDGVWRKFDYEADDDDGSPFSSLVTLGAIRTSPNDVDNAILAEVHGILGMNSGYVACYIARGDSAEEATTNAIENMVTAPGHLWGGNETGRYPVFRPRLRGPWCAIILVSAEKWTYEAVVLKSRQLGRLRV